MSDETNRSEHRALGWAAIGGALVAIGVPVGTGLAFWGATSHLWGDSYLLAGFAVGCVLTALGVYVLIAEFIGGIGPLRFPLPPTRQEREAARRQPPPNLSSPPIASTDSPIPATPVLGKPKAIDATPKYLVGLFDDHTSIQAQKLASAYIGKWIRVSGLLGDVGEFGIAGTQVVFKREMSDVTVFMWFHDEHYVKDRLAILKKGHPITVLGQIDRISAVDLQLKHCQLEDANV